jgi:hypothetical protein
MKYGWQLVYHKDIPEDDKKMVEEFINDKYKHFSSPNSYKVGYTNSHSYYRRGVFGLRVDNKSKYTFKRLVRGSRIFGVVPTDLLVDKQGNPIDTNQCMCAIHLGGTRVDIKGGYNPADYVVVYEVGEIKG